MNFIDNILRLADPEIRLDSFSPQEKLTEFQNIVQLWAEDWNEQISNQPEQEVEIPHYDALEPVRKYLHWNNLTIGITHPKGSRRYDSPMRCHYGHILRSYPDDPEGKAFDIYVGDRPEESSLWKVNQLTEEGEIEEPKYLLFEDIEQAKNTFLLHVPRTRFGGIMPADLNELAFYRNDGCGCKDISAELRAGLEILPEEALDYIWTAPPHSELTTTFIQSVLEGIYPDSIDGLQNVTFQPLERIITGEFFSPNGLYGFKLQKNYIGYGIKNPALDSVGTPRTDGEGDKDVLDYLIDDALESSEPLVANWIDQINERVGKAKSLEEARDSIYDTFDKLDSNKIADHLYKQRIIARLSGNIDVLEEGELE